ncbi:cytochrome b/b6 domain-containing protein [Vibrio lentus]|uniref:Cytochrome B n=1 Tax=Vibrio lentus TaxID=136468 RepID=A0AB36XVR7_9VIBR|nr:cytochrome b/b6 domain-containing protein [Vibrio lentus]MCC4835568.1 cytochrome b/b6 domain-containing protein [Vibrio lentus]PMI16755.1 cytochrome B [Vibrio lentus]PMK36720.1 cytochrome B [Vibrio lentus]PMK50295.1 cytochrome B [Vibrio lentus]PML28001.1 cytochrome B [Vibrio lentus]
MNQEIIQNRINKHENNKVDSLHWAMLCAVMMTLTLGFISSRLLPFPDKYPTILIHQIFGSVVLVLINILIARMLAKPKRGERRFTIPRVVQLIQAVTLTFIAVSGLSIALIDTPIFSVYSWVFSEGATKREIVGLLFFIHATAIKVFMSLVTLHVLGAMKHHFFDKGDKLKNMLGK